MVHLNTNTLIGFTEKRGNAWHYRAVLQGAESNHYPGAIPVADVRRRLLNWQAVPRRVAIEFPATVETMTHLNDQGEPVRWAVQQNRQAITPSNRDVVMGLFKDGYKIHQYDAWLLDNVATIVDDELAISSAGLLRDGALAWVEVSIPETITTPEGVAFRPNLLAATSFDGSLATTIKRTVQATVCDNTLAVAQREKGQTVKIRHSSGSLGRITSVRQALSPRAQHCRGLRGRRQAADCTEGDRAAVHAGDRAGVPGQRPGLGARGDHLGQQDRPSHAPVPVRSALPRTGPGS